LTQEGEHHDDRGVQPGDRQNAPADRHRTQQLNDAKTATRGKACRPFHCSVLFWCAGQNSFHLANAFDQLCHREPRSVPINATLVWSRSIALIRLCSSASFFLAELAGMEHPVLVTATAEFRDHAAHVAQRLYGRIVLVPGIGGAKFARRNTR
jgi:hypothetical protein